MSDQIKKGSSQGGKKNTEEKQCQVYLESSIGMNVLKFRLALEENNKKNIILSEGIKNKVFIFENDRRNNFQLGNFSINDLVTIMPQAKNDKVNREYKLHFATANLQGSLDLPELKSSSNEFINPFLNKRDAFKYQIPENISGNINKLSPKRLVSFEILTTIKCCNCPTVESPENPMYFCWTDNQIFCSQCDKTWHEQNEKKSLGYHYRTKNYKYTLTYYGNCETHNGRPYQYFDEKNKLCLCVKCLENLNSNERDKPNIKFIDDYIKNKENEEDFLNNKINEVCNDIDQRIENAEEIWKNIDEYEKNYYEESIARETDIINKVMDEGFARSTFLSCLFMEIQRIIKEIDSKVIFNKNQRNNVDVSTFLYLNQIYNTYMSKELNKNLDNLANINLENFVKPIINGGNGEIDYDEKFEIPELPNKEVIFK